MIADDYLNGAINGLVSQAIAGILASFMITILLFFIWHPSPAVFGNSHGSMPELLFINSIFNGIGDAIFGSIMGSVSGIFRSFHRTYY